MAYAVETRTDTSITKRLFRTFEMKTLRMIAGYIRDICDTTDVVRWTKKPTEKMKCTRITYEK